MRSFTFGVVFLVGIMTSARAQPAPSSLSDPSQVVPTVQRVPGEEEWGDPITLEELLRIASQYNFALRSARYSSDIAEASVKTEAGAFQPLLTASGNLASQTVPDDLRFQVLGAGITRQFALGTVVDLSWQTMRTRAPGTADPQEQVDNGLVLSLRQPLLEGLNVADAGVRSARFLRDAALLRTRWAEVSMVAEITQAYLALAEAEKIEEVHLVSVQIADSLLYRNLELNRRQLAPEIDVLIARSGLALRQANLVSARRQRLDSAEALAFLVYGSEAAVRLPAGARLFRTTGGQISPPRLPSLETAEEQAIAARSDLAAIRQELAALGTSVETSRNALRPNLDLVGSYGSSATDLQSQSALSGLTDDRSWSLGLVLSGYLGNRADRGRYESDRLQLEQGRLHLQEYENFVRQSVRAAWRGVESSLERLEFARSASEFSDRQLQAERQRLELGLGDSFRVLETEENAIEAHLQAVEAEFELGLAITQYNLVTGGFPSGTGL